MSDSNDIVDFNKRTVKEILYEQTSQIGELGGRLTELSDKVSRLETDLIKRNTLSEEREKRRSANIGIMTALGAFLGYIIHTVIMFIKE